MGPQGPQCIIETDFCMPDLCIGMPRPLVMTGALIQWMRCHFQEAKNIEHTSLKSRIWTSDNLQTEIQIDSVWKYTPTIAAHSPGIYVKRGPWKILRYGIDDRKMMSTGGCVTRRRYVSFTQGSHTLFCVAGESAEVEVLAAEVYRELMMFGPEARKKFNLLRFQLVDVGDVKLLDESTENFVVPITVAYGGQDVWEMCS